MALEYEKCGTLIEFMIRYAHGLTFLRPLRRRFSDALLESEVVKPWVLVRHEESSSTMFEPIGSDTNSGAISNVDPIILDASRIERQSSSKVVRSKPMDEEPDMQPVPRLSLVTKPSPITIAPGNSNQKQQIPVPQQQHQSLRRVKTAPTKRNPNNRRKKRMMVHVDPEAFMTPPLASNSSSSAASPKFVTNSKVASPTTVKSEKSPSQPYPLHRSESLMFPFSRSRKGAVYHDRSHSHTSSPKPSHSPAKESAMSTGDEQDFREEEDDEVKSLSKEDIITKLAEDVKTVGVLLDKRKGGLKMGL